MSLRLLHDALGASPRHASPCLVLGDPTPEISLRLAQAAIGAGATMLELVFPYDDPCADGPAMQRADLRARRAGMTTDRAFELMAALRGACPATPFNLLVYGNLVHARGYGSFCRDAVAAGASSLLVPDICLEESEPLQAACHRQGLGAVHLVGPLTPVERLTAYDRASDAFLYLAANQSVTGKRSESGESKSDLVRRVASIVENPLCVGFGLSRREQLVEAFAAGARIAVVASHLARAIEAAWDESKGDAGEVERSFIDAWIPLARSAARTGEASPDSEI